MLLSRLRAGAFAVLVAAGTAIAADHPIAGDRLSLRDSTDASRRAMSFTAAREPAIDPGAAADPRSVGATLEVTGAGAGNGATGPISLDKSMWVGLGKPPGTKGYKFSDLNESNGVRRALFKKSGASGGALKLSGGGSNWPYQITQAQGSISVRFTIGADLYCAQFESFRSNQTGKVVARAAPAPASCATPVPPACGDGVVTGTEECDDGGTASGDGCSSTCELESAAAICTGVPTVSGTALDAVRVASGLERPVYVTAPPLDPNRVFVVEQNGRIRIIKNGVLLPTAFLSIEGKVSCCGEQGLLSMAFHPSYESNGRFFVSYTAPGGGAAGHSVVAEYQVSATPDVADAMSETVLLTVDQPFSNHNGGLITFGPDGFLYLGLGDGGSGGDPLEAGQDDATALGKLLRIDVDDPPANPVNAIWAKGLRNPWRYSFDRATGDLYIADVGQGSWEEVNLQAGPSAAGVNYGWDVFEGRHCFDPAPLFTAGDCSDVPGGFSVAPVLEYSHGQGCSITGGYVYRGCRMPDLRGTYFYSDFCSAFIRTFQSVSGGNAQNLADRTADVAPGGGLSIDSVSSFGEDARGELYVTDLGSGGFDGEVFKIVPGS